jgi:prepilin-type processing-associated H-X9-DG protein
MLLAENKWVVPDMHVSWLWGVCQGLFTHSTGQVANFVFCDGHAKPMKWLKTLFPISENVWQADEPSTDPKKRKLTNIPGCDYRLSSR